MSPTDSLSYDEIRDRVRSPRVRALLEAFAFEHLPPELQAVSKPFCDLAHLNGGAMGCFPSDEQETHLEHGLERLLEAKDAIVRAALRT